MLLVAAPGHLESWRCSTACEAQAVLSLLLLVALLQASVVRNWDYSSAWMGERKILQPELCGGL